MSDVLSEEKIPRNVGDISPAALNLLGAVAVSSARAVSFEQAIQDAINQICTILDWPLGHAFVVQRDSRNGEALTSTGIWHVRDEALHAEFKRVTRDFSPEISGISRSPQWRHDVSKQVGFKRGKLTTAQLNIGAAFNLPIMFAGRIVAVLEFFNDLPCARNDSILQISEMLALHLGKAFELTDQFRMAAEMDIVSQQTILDDRMLALSEMARGISHEINNPMTIAMGHMSLLRGHLIKKKVMDSTTTGSLDKIGKSLIRVANVVKSMRQFCKDASDDPLEKICVVDLIQKAVSLCAASILEEDVILTVESDIPPNVFVESMGSQLSQVIVSLIHNSIEAVSASKSKWILIQTIYSSEKVGIIVVDSGFGIPKNVQNRMMDPFFSTKLVGKGSGLGLSSAKGVVEAHGGKLHYVDDAANTTFKIELIRAED